MVLVNPGSRLDLLKCDTQKVSFLHDSDDVRSVCIIRCDTIDSVTQSETNVSHLEVVKVKLGLLNKKGHTLF